MDRTLIDEYEAGAAVPGQAIVGLTKAQLLATPVPGTWSIQQIVLHLMDSDLIASDRMKRVAAEDDPLIVAYDETRFAERLGYDQADAAMACEVFRLNRLMTAALLRGLPDAAFTRTGRHSETGPKSLARFVATYVEHLAGHMTHLTAKRKLV